MMSIFNRFLGHIREPLYGNGYALVFSSVANSGLGIVYWILAAQNYSTDVIGINTAIISTISFLAYLSQLNLTNILNRFLPTAGRASRQIVTFSHIVSIFITMLISMIFVLTVNYWVPDLGFIGSTLKFAVWVITATIVWNVFTLQDSSLIGFRKAVWVPIKNLLFASLKICLLIYFINISPKYGVFASWNIAAIIVILPTVFLIFKILIPQHMEKKGVVERKIDLTVITRYMAGDYFGSLISHTVMSLLPIIIIAQIGPSANAYYSMAASISYMLYLVSRNMGTSLVAEAAGNEDKLIKYTFLTFVNTARLLVPLVIIIYVGAPYLLRLFGESYAAEGVLLLRLLSLSSLPNLIITLFTSMVRVQERIPALFASLAGPYILILVFSFVLIGPMGLKGIGLAWLIAQSLIALFLLKTQFWNIWRKNLVDQFGKKKGNVTIIKNL